MRRVICGLALVLCLVAALGYVVSTYSGAKVMDYVELLTQPDTVLVKYSSAIVGTVGGDCSETLVLMTTGDPDKLRLDCISEAVGEEQVCVSCYVPTEAAEACLEHIDEAGMKNWRNLKNPVAISGRAQSCIFRDGDQYVSVSTEAMPEDGTKKLSHVGQILKGYAHEAKETAEGQD